MDIGGVFGDGPRQQHAIRVVIDRGGAFEARLGEVIVFAQILAVVLVQRLDDPAIAGGEIAEQDAAGVEMVGIGVPDGADRGDRLQGGVAGGGGEIAGGTQV